MSKHRRPRARPTFPIDPELLRKMGEGLAPALAERKPRLEQAKAQLAAAGYDATITCPACPIQIEGRLPSGERFYFRARWDRAHLEVGGKDDADSFALFRQPERTWRRGAANWTAPEASWLDPLDAVALLSAWVQDFRMGRGGEAEVWKPEADLARTLADVRRKHGVFVTDDRRLQHLGAVDTETFLRQLEAEEAAKRAAEPKPAEEEPPPSA